MLKTQTKKITAFMSVMAMLLSMLLYFPNGTFSLDFGLKASAATITPSKPGGEGTSDSPYKIGTAAELYWFAACVNGTDGITQNKSAWAVLTADITVNRNLLSSLKYDTGGNVTNGDNFTSWTPIGNYDDNEAVNYTRTFDGQGHTVSGLYFNDTSTGYIGLFGRNYGTVKNVRVVDSYFKGSASVGGVCGFNFGEISNCYNTGAVNATGHSASAGGVCGSNNGRITNCYNTGTVIATGDDTAVGGVCGYNNGTITNCYNTGAVNATGTKTFVGGVCGWNGGPIRNCYYDRDKYSGNAVASNSGTVNDVEGKATARFKSGEVAYLLQSGQTADDSGNIPEVWGQKIGTDNYPVLGGVKVSATTGCVTYNNEGNTAAKEHNYTFTADKHSCIDCGLTENHNFGDDGVCTACNTYKISTADQLYTFADKVKNENLNYKNVNAVLAADITVNTGVLKSDGSLADDTSGFRIWTPIGYSDSLIYTGTFDGQGHTVSGLYFNDSGANFVGLFGCVGTSGSVSNVGVVDSYFNGNNNVGGVSGYCNGKIINCYNKSTVSGSKYVGGVCGEVGPDSKSVIANCYNTGIIKGESNTACVVGYSATGNVLNCYYYGEKAEDDDNPPLVTQPINPTIPSNTAVSFVPSITTTNRLIPGIIKTTATTTTTTTTTTTENTTSVTVSETSSSTQSSSDTSAATKDEHATCKTPEQFKSGEVAYLLSQGCTIGETTYDGSVWGQTIGKEKYPVLGGAKVYTASNNCIGYSNTENDTRAHNYVNGICQWCGDIENNVMIYGQSVTLDGTIGMNVYVVADDDYTDWTASFNDKVVEKPEKDENGLYKFTYQVAAKDMELNIKFSLSNGDSVTVSVKGYLDTLDTSGSEVLAELAEAMETYGDAASEYFKTDGAVPEVAGVADNACDGYGFTKNDAPEGISYYGSSLILESETTVRHYFTLAEGRNIENFKFYVDDVEVTPKEKQNYYYIDIENISAENLDTPHTVKIDDIEVISNYSALSYASAVLNSDTADDNLKNLVKTLYLYNQKANAYGSN